MDKYELIKREVESILPKSPLVFELDHSRLVHKWLLLLKPNADEGLQIAAISHDIDRALTGITEKDLKDFSEINKFKKEHSVRSANFTEKILIKFNYPRDSIFRIKNLIENHEFGGDSDSDILMEADSLAYFEYNIPFYLKRNGEIKTREKIRFMYNRLSNNGKKMVKQIKYDDVKIGDLVISVISEII